MRRDRLSRFALERGALAVLLCACSCDPSGPGGSDPIARESCQSDADCAVTFDRPFCDTASGECTPLPAGHQLGLKDGRPAVITFFPEFVPDEPLEPWDLAFNPSKPTELWVLNHKDDSVYIVEDPGTPEMAFKRRRDPAASHFMDAPSAMAFGAVVPPWGQTFGVCGDNDGSAHGTTDFAGPSLFSAELDIFAEPTPGGLGSHLDMLHSTSFCRGIAHVADNVYFVFNSQKGSLDRYDFGADHGPGEDDHGDGAILRYVEGSVAGVDGAPSHLVYNREDAHLYVADTGHGRIVKLDTTSGALGDPFPGFEAVAVRRRVDGATLAEVVPPGVVEQPAGIALHDGVLFVTDAANSRFYAFDLQGNLLRRLETGFPPGSLAGLVIGPDGKIHFVDRGTGGVYRIDPGHTISPQ
jgi:DNA-binding beta-propeller fold protein YncE